MTSLPDELRFKLQTPTEMLRVVDVGGVFSILTSTGTTGINDEAKAPMAAVVAIKAITLQRMC
jgi:hypothetical protein